MVAKWMFPDSKPEISTPEFKQNPESYSGPMVVLVNENVRSGKEALAHQFKKTKRARLIGSKTAGYFSMGEFLFVEEPKDYIFYMCVAKAEVDGVDIEGRGISPDIEVPFSSEGEFGDSQLNAAIQALVSTNPMTRATR